MNWFRAEEAEKGGAELNGSEPQESESLSWAWRDKLNAARLGGGEGIPGRRKREGKSTEQQSGTDG